MEDPERLLPLHGCLAFFEHIARTEKLADLGLTVGLQTRFDQLGAFADMVRGASTLHEALNRLIGAIALFNSGERVWLDYQGERALFCHAYTVSDAPGRRHGELYATAMMIAAIRAVLGPRWMPNGVRLSRAEEPNRKRYETILGVPVVCEGQSQAIEFARALLAARPMPCHPAPIGHEADYDFLRATAPAEDFAGCVRQTIGTLLCDGYPDIQRTAEAVGVSVRSPCNVASPGRMKATTTWSIRCGSKPASRCCVTKMSDSSISPGSWATPTRPTSPGPSAAGPEWRRAPSGARA